MKSICIGIYLHTEPKRLEATLASLRLNTPLSFELLLLPDGPDGPTRRALGNLSNVRQLEDENVLGGAACFNRLGNGTDAEVMVLLENGAQVAPRWLDHLLSALDDDPRNGLAGPSTNLCWNEQQVFPSCGSSSAEIARAAQEAAHRFGNEA